MSFIADLHIHSSFSRATSSECRLEKLAAWGEIKGIRLLGTGDFTHPAWFSDIKEGLTDAEPGFFKLKKPSQIMLKPGLIAENSKTRFILSGEISNIYKKNGKTRKNHNIIFAPDLQTAEKISSRLSRIGNIHSDGRPILGLDAKRLLEIVIESSPHAFLIPAHIWTPWFSLFGSKSGFDHLEECFEDLSPHIFALETGLSSDPPMNWMVSQLDGYSLISNSDAHSPEKLGRECNLFECPFDYFSLFQALKTKSGFLGTAEFYPEEGKYHYDGHRKCGVCLSPEESLRSNGLCPVCGKELTIGVLNRVVCLADRKMPKKPENSADFFSLIPLAEIIAETLGVTPLSKKVVSEYVRLVKTYGPELSILLDKAHEELDKDPNPLLGLAIAKMRSGNVVKNPGYDGEFGKIKIFTEDEKHKLLGQDGFFAFSKEKKPSSLKLPAQKKHKEQPARKAKGLFSEISAPKISDEQKKAIEGFESRLLISAGPGTGKTWTLIKKIIFLLQEKRISPESVMAVTFTNRAAKEMRERLEAMLGKDISAKITVSTIHKFFLDWLRHNIKSFDRIIDEEERKIILRTLFAEAKENDITALSETMTCFFKTDFLFQESLSFAGPDPRIQSYLSSIRKFCLLDIDLILAKAYLFLKENPDALQSLCARFRYLFIDEFQDLDRSQYEIFRLLANSGAAVCAIGDARQAIYSFRGASPEYFHRFKEDFQAKEISLIRNYRNPELILSAANAVISRAKGLFSAPSLVAFKKQPGRVFFHESPTEKSESEFVVSKIEDLTGGISFFSVDSGRSESAYSLSSDDISFKDIAVLFRTNLLSSPLEEAFSRSGIPYQMVGQKAYYLQPPVEPLTLTLRVALEKTHLPSWERMLKKYLSLPKNHLQGFMKKLSLNLFSSHENADLKDVFSHLDPCFSQKKKKELLDPLFLILQQLDRKQENITDHLLRLCDLFSVPRENPQLTRFMHLVQNHDSLEALLKHIQDNVTLAYDEHAEAVTLMSLHASKGLEFDIVFIIGCEEGLIPYSAQGRPPTDIEEERRLFYVGMTRARKYLFLTQARNRFLFGKKEISSSSRFIKDIPRENLSIIKQKWRKKEKLKQMELFS